MHATVTSFYEQYNKNYSFELINLNDSDKVCPGDDEEIALRNRNHILIASCASVQMQVLQNGLKVLRRVLHIIIEVQYIIFNLFVGIFRLVLPIEGETSDSIFKDIEYWFMQLIVIIHNAVKSIGDLIFQMTFDSGGLGGAMKNILKAVCEMINIILVVWNNTGCVIGKTIILPIFKGILDVINSILSLIPGLDRSFLNFFDIFIDFIKEMSCSIEIPCGVDLSSTVGIPLGALPVASQCWTDFKPEVDTFDSLSCSASDTCVVGTLDYGTTVLQFGGLADDNRERVCDACPMQPGNQVNDFGCDLYTRKCTCNRIKQDTTSCMRNDECIHSGDTQPNCVFMSDFTTGESFGTIKCSSCTNNNRPTCHVLSANGVGKCTCMQTSVPVQPCSGSNIGVRVTASNSQMCMLISDASSQRQNSYYEWNSLATTPCELISAGNHYCYNVNPFGKLVVGYVISGNAAQRRLLSATFNMSNASEKHRRRKQTHKTILSRINFFDTWDNIASPCVDLVNAYTTRAVMVDT